MRNSSPVHSTRLVATFLYCSRGVSKGRDVCCNMVENKILLKKNVVLVVLDVCCACFDVYTVFYVVSRRNLFKFTRKIICAVEAG